MKRDILTVHRPSPPLPYFWMHRVLAYLLTVSLFLIQIPFVYRATSQRFEDLLSRSISWSPNSYTLSSLTICKCAESIPVAPSFSLTGFSSLDFAKLRAVSYLFCVESEVPNLYLQIKFELDGVEEELLPLFRSLWTRSILGMSQICGGGIVSASVCSSYDLNSAGCGS